MCGRSGDKGIGDVNYSFVQAGASRHKAALLRTALGYHQKFHSSNPPPKLTEPVRATGAQVAAGERAVYLRFWKEYSTFARDQHVLFVLNALLLGYYQWLSISASIRESSLVSHYSGFVNVASQV